MLEVARAVAPTITWRDGSALDPPLAEGERFDVVTCQQGRSSSPTAPSRPACAAPRPPRPAGVTWRPVDDPDVRDCSPWPSVISALSINGTLGDGGQPAGCWRTPVQRGDGDTVTRLARFDDVSASCG
jgi:hypothetical protein